LHNCANELFSLDPTIHSTTSQRLGRNSAQHSTAQQ
jgi:hypothetical protein